jgi:hypothetical protein
MSEQIVRAISPVTYSALAPDPVLPFRWRSLPWIAGGFLLLTLQLATGTDPTYALLIFAFVLLTGVTLAALDGVTTPVGCCVALLAFQHVLLCQTVKALYWQRPDTPLLRPVETATVYVIGMASLLAGALIWRQIRPANWTPLFRRELDPRRLFWMTLICFTIGFARFVLSRTGSRLIGINAADVFEPLSAAAGTAYVIVVSKGRRSFGWENAFPMLLCFATGVLGATRLNLMTGPLMYYLTCYLFRFRFRWVHLVVLLAAVYVAQFILFPYALYARGVVRTKDLDTNIARATDVFIKVVMDPVKYQQMQANDTKVDPATKRLRYFGEHITTLDRFAIIIWADGVVDATLIRGTTKMKTIEPGFMSLLPGYLSQQKSSAGTSNALAHRGKGMVGKYDYFTQITLGFFCDAFSSYSWLGVAIIPALILLGYSLIYHLLFDRTLWGNVLAIGVVKAAAWTFSEAPIAPQISNVFSGIIVLSITMWGLRGLINLTQNFHDARLRARRQRSVTPLKSYPA